MKTNKKKHTKNDKKAQVGCGVPGLQYQLRQVDG